MEREINAQRYRPVEEILISYRFFSLTTAAQGEACMDALRDRAMAVEMKEYELMIISADNVIQRCEWRVGRNYGRLVADKILANAMLGRYAEG